MAKTAELPPAPPEDETAGAKWLTDDPAFRAAVAEAAAEHIAAFKAELLATVRPDANPALPTDAMALIQALALNIAQLGTQNDRDRPVDPAVLAARAKGMEKLHNLIRSAKALPKNDPAAPKWRVTAKVVLSDTIINPWKRDPARKLAVPVEFRWRGEPNGAFVPLNDTAKAIMEAFNESRGSKRDYEKEVYDSVWMSDGGLIIEGTGRPIPHKRQIMAVEDPGELEIDDDPYSPNASKVHVLGTLHEPAQQHFENKVP